MTIEVANKLIELRKSKGLSQEELADRLGISRQAVSKWERAESSPDIDNIIMLSRLYGISVDELLLNGDASSMDEAELHDEREQDREAPVGTADGIERITVSVRGNVELIGTDGSACTVTLSGQEEEKEKVRLIRDGDTFTIVQDEEDEGFFGRMFNFGKHNLGVTVYLPRRMRAITADLKGGNLAVTGLNADSADAKLGGGRASVEDCVIKELTLLTGGGSILIKNLTGGTARLRTGGGSIKAESVCFTGRLEAMTGGGSVMLSGEMREVEAGSGGGDVRLFVKKAASIDAKTGGGGIAVELSGTEGVDAELRTGGGRTRLVAYGNEVMSGKNVRATVGTGETVVRAVSGGGSVLLTVR